MPEVDAEKASPKAGTIHRQQTTVDRIVLPSPALSNGGAPTPEADEEGFDCPLLPNLGRSTGTGKPVKLRVYRFAYGKEIHRGNVPLSAGPEELTELWDHGQGGTYRLYPITQDNKSYPGRGEIELEPDPVRYATYRKEMDDRSRLIAGGGPEGESAAANEIARLRATVDDLMSAQKQPAPLEGGPLMPILERLVEGQNAIAQALNRQPDFMSQMTGFATLMNTLRPPVAAPTAGGGVAEIMAAAKMMLDVTGGKAVANPDDPEMQVKKIEAFGNLFNNLLPKVAGAVSVIADEIRGPAKPGEHAAADSAAPPPKEESKMAGVKALMDELEVKLLNPSIPAEQIAREFKEGISANPPRIPRWIGSMLRIVDASNLDSQLDALERPSWGKEPARTKFLAAVEILKK